MTTPQTAWIGGSPPVPPPAPQPKRRGPKPGAAPKPPEAPRREKKATIRAQELVQLRADVASALVLREERDRFFNNWADEKTKKQQLEVRLAELERELASMKAAAEQRLAGLEDVTNMVKLAAVSYAKLSKSLENSDLTGDNKYRLRVRRKAVLTALAEKLANCVVLK